MSKNYVGVLALYEPNGDIRPLEIILKDGYRYPIDTVKQVCSAASLKSGGIGTRFTCVIRGQLRYLYLEEKQQRWFVERL